jgi:Double zinc ribbon
MRQGPVTLADLGISCASCGLENAANARFCKSCGKSLRARFCPECKTEFKQGQKFCVKCGASLPADKSCSACGGASPTQATICSHCGAPLAPSIEKEPVETVGGEEGAVDPPLQPLSDTNLDPGSADRTQIQARTENDISASWIAQHFPWVAKKPQAIWTIVAGLVVVAAVAMGTFWYFGRGSASSGGAPAAQDAGTFSGVLYTLRLTHIRNAPTSVGTVVVGDVQAGQVISGAWVLGHDGVTRWLRIHLQNGNYGFVWGKNLSASPANSGTATAAPRSSVQQASPTSNAIYADSVAFCRAVGTSDDPTKDGRYTGPHATPSMLNAFDVSTREMLSRNFRTPGDGVVWRCMDARMYVCAEWNTTACTKAPWLDQKNWPIPSDLQDFCRANPNSECAGATHCIFGCRGRSPAFNVNSYPVDTRGFSTKEWVAASR